MRACLWNVVPRAGVQQALEQRGRVPVDEMHIAADGFIEELEDAMSRMLVRHGGESVGEVLDEGEDHAAALARH
jgi:hypothetical protein